MLKELPEKWACLYENTSEDRKLVTDYGNKFWGSWEYSFDSTTIYKNNKYLSFPHNGKPHTNEFIPQGYTEITFEDFKRLVLQETPINNELEIEIW
jgi:hypothetical protein